MNFPFLWRGGGKERMEDLLVGYTALYRLKILLHLKFVCNLFSKPTERSRSSAFSYFSNDNTKKIDPILVYLEPKN